jgi:hypothetical protein
MWTKATSVGSTVGLVYGLYFSMKGKKNLTETALYTLGFGLVGLVVGKAFDKFYE